MCCDCMIAWCCVVWLCVKWVHWQSQTKIERGQHTGVIVWCGEWWVCRKKSGGMVDWKRGKDGVKDTVTQKQKDALFPQTTFSLLFPFPKLFPFPDSLLLLSSFTLYHAINALFIHKARAHLQWTQTQNNTTLNLFIVFLSYPNSHLHRLSFTNRFLWWSFNNDHHTFAK